MELKKRLVFALAHTISCVALHRRRYGIACFERLASGASQSNDKPFFEFHRVYHLKYHLVLVTKYRRKCFTKPILDRLKEIFLEQGKKWDVALLEFGGEEDHVHLLLELHPNIMPSKLVNSFKTVSSRLIRKEFPKQMKQYYWKPVLWTRAYCLVSAGGAPLSILKNYIQKQGNSEK